MMTELTSDQSAFIRKYIAELPVSGIGDVLTLSEFQAELAQDDTPQDEAPDPNAAAWAERFAELEPKVARALSEGGIADPGGLRATWSLAVERGDSGLAGAALELLPRIEKLMVDKVTTRADGPPDGHVEFMQLVMDWQARKAAFQRQLDDLSAALDADTDDADTADDGAPQALKRALNGFNQNLSQQIEAVQDAAFPQDRMTGAAAAVKIAQHYLDYVETDPLIAHIRQNPYGVDADGTALLGAPLRRIIAHLGTVAAPPSIAQKG